jgi:hypothetical protein
MANVTITQLPTAGAITGSELVPIVQNGVTVQTTTGAIAASPSQTQTFLTLNQEPTLPNSRRLSGGTGVGLTDAGAQSTLQITLNRASGSLEAAGNGIIAKTASNAVTARELAVSGAGLSVTNGTGVSGNPTFALSGVAAAVANLGGTGIMAIQNGTNVGGVVILGTSNQIAVANGNGTGNPTISLVDNVVLPGTGAVTLPIGDNSQEPVGANGQLRYNSEEGAFYGYTSGSWRQFSTSGGVTEVNTGTGLQGGPITGVGTISIDDTVVATLSGSQTLTNKTISGSSNTLSNIANSSLTNSSVTYNGVTVALGDSGTITAASPNALTAGTGLQLNSGTTYDGSAAKTISIDSTVATLSGTQTLTNKTIDANSNTLSNIPNSSLVSYSITLGTTTTSLGGTSLTLGGLTSVTVTQDPTSDLQLATKQYVDNVAQGLNVKTACLWGTTGNITLSGLTTQAGGEWTGTLTAGDRILVKNQSTAADNGIYVAASGSWARSTDANTWNELVSAFVFVQDGTTLGDTGWVCTVNPGGTLGVTAVTWTQFSGAGTYTAGTGLTLTGTQFSITNTGVTAASYGTASKTSTLVINAQGQITSASEQDIAIAASQVTSGTLAVAQGGTNIGSYTIGDLLYASGTTTLSKLGIGASTYIVTSDGSAPSWTAPASVSVGTATNLAGGTAGALPYQTGSGATSFLSLGTTNYVLTAGASAPQYVAQSTLSVGSATNATNSTNIAITADSTNATNYLAFVDATSGNKAALVNSSITCNPSTGALTGGIVGGTF